MHLWGHVFSNAGTGGSRCTFKCLDGNGKPGLPNCHKRDILLHLADYHRVNYVSTLILLQHVFPIMDKVTAGLL